MQKSFENILSFTQAKDNCLFCQTPLRASLRNFMGLKKTGMPLLNQPIKYGRFNFLVKNSTPSYNVEANTVIDIVSNKLSLTISKTSTTSILDQHVAKMALDDLMPHIELACPNKNCKNHYYLSCSVFKIEKLSSTFWLINPLKLYIESFETNNFLVQNNWLREETNIYSLRNPDIQPIKISMLDFEELGKEKLLSRIHTLVNFS